MKVSICIPWIREKNIIRCVKMIYENAGCDFELLVEEDRERIGCPKMLKKLVKRAENELICFLGDDTLPQRNFLLNAVEHMKTFKDGFGLVGLNDQTGRILPTHWLASKRLLPMLGGEFFNTSYTHLCCDQELMYRAQEAGRYIYAQDAIVLHDHPILKGKPVTDPDYIRVYSKKVRSKDQALFLKRRANNWK